MFRGWVFVYHFVRLLVFIYLTRVFVSFPNDMVNNACFLRFSDGLSKIFLLIICYFLKRLLYT